MGAKYESCIVGSYILLLHTLMFFSCCYSNVISQADLFIEEEKLILLEVYNEWSNSNSTALQTWNNDYLQHCNWTGIKCVDGSVTEISLSSQNLNQEIPKIICSLKNLQLLDLSNNDITGNFPATLYNCSNLVFLDISKNVFVGFIPSDIDQLSTKLEYLNLAANNFTGSIPPTIGLLPSIKSLYLNDNHLNGSFPVELGNLSTLEYLFLAYNPFTPSKIPHYIGNMTNLNSIWLSTMNLIGKIPDSLGNLSDLVMLDLSTNYLHGTIPASIWNLGKLQNLWLYNNSLTGEINGPGVALDLLAIDLSDNQLTGPIPEDFGKLENLTALYLYRNDLSGEIPTSIGKLQSLTDIKLFDNQLTGVLPPELGKHSMLYNFEVWNNRISGKLPEYLCANQVLNSLIAYNNNFTGGIPFSVANCSTLVDLKLYQNKFNDDFPVGFWSAVQNLRYVIIHHNSFTGNLPDKLPWNLSRLELNDNLFSGSLPSSAPNLQVLKASNNLFSGEVPRVLDKLSKLYILQIGKNQISGSIPPSICSLKFLTDFNMSHNRLSGQIPVNIGSLPVLTSLDLSYNNLTGSIPEGMSNLPLSKLNLSYNQFSGQIPVKLFNQADEWSFLGNQLLCLPTKSTHSLPMCPIPNKSFKISKKLLVLFYVLGGFFFLMTLLVSSLYYRKKRESRDVESWKLTSFSKLEINEGEIVHGLITRNIIGRGGSGEVYKITLNDGAGPTLAVKKIFNDKRLDAKLEKQFEAEVEILSSIRHVNIVQLLCCISSSNSKLVVYEFVENGSLNDWLKGKQKRSEYGELIWLDWPKRIKIAVDAAEGLCYMHHHCAEPIVHRDVKSSNILLDKDFGAKIADFGLARMLVKAGEPETVSCMAGTFGYMAPECGYSKKVNEKMDVYSFGVVLLELTTGRIPTNCSGSCIADWALQSYQQDCTMMSAIDEQIGDDPSCIDEIKAMFVIGLRCTTRSPLQRPTMKVVLEWLKQIQGTTRDDSSFEEDASFEEDSFLPYKTNLK